MGNCCSEPRKHEISQDKDRGVIAQKYARRDDTTVGSPGNPDLGDAHTTNQHHHNNDVPVETQAHITKDAHTGQQYMVSNDKPEHPLSYRHPPEKQQDDLTEVEKEQPKREAEAYDEDSRQSPDIHTTVITISSRPQTLPPDLEDTKKHENISDSTQKKKESIYLPPNRQSTKLVTSRNIPAIPAKTQVDVVLIFSPGYQGNEVALTMKDKLESSSLSVWAEGQNCSLGENIYKDTEEAIMNAKTLVVLLSEESAKEANISEKVSLATIAKVSLFPVALHNSSDVLMDMPLELKTHVAKYKWVELASEPDQEVQLDLLVKTISEELDTMTTRNPHSCTARPDLCHRQRLVRSFSQGDALTAATFWDTQLGAQEDIAWETFQSAFEEKYGDHMSRLVPDIIHSLLMESLSKRMEVDGAGMLNRLQFIDFCHQDGTDHDVWDVVHGLASQIQAVRDIFDGEAALRTLVRENIGHIGIEPVMSVLQDLLGDSDANVRALATVSLSQFMDPEDDMSLTYIIQLLTDSDRLVREAACLALGQLKAEPAVDILIHVWRNDVISHVRNAASLALNQIGGDRVLDAMRVTTVLADEIRMLTDDTNDSS